MATQFSIFAWWATVHGVEKSQTQRSAHSHTRTPKHIACVNIEINLKKKDILSMQYEKYRKKSCKVKCTLRSEENTHRNVSVYILPVGLTMISFIHL